MDEFDYIIVGAGSAGCVLAHRLSADSATRVLLIEAGGRDNHPLVKVPKGLVPLMDNPRTAWHYQVQPFGPTDRVEVWPRGRMLGGSGSLNGMVYNRGQRADWDELERLGNPGWGWATMLAAFKQMEDHALGASDVRGAGGPLHVSPTSNTPEADGLCEDLIEAGGQLGWRRTEDPNDTDDERIGYTIATIKDGQRFNAARAFLHPVEQRPNLTVLVDTAVLRVLVENGRAVGVRTRRAGGEVVDYAAAGEVIVSSGALASPRLLQLSGIGPANTLRSAGVDVLVDSPNVGARMREHRLFRLQYRLSEDVGYNRRLNTAPRQAVAGIKYLLTRKGPLANPASDVIGFFKTRPELDRPDAQVLMAPHSAEPQIPGKHLALERSPGMMCLAKILRPDSEGSVRITSADPDAALEIVPNYFATEHDRRVGVDLFRRTRELFSTNPIAKRIQAETEPGPAAQDDQEIIDAAFEQGVCGYHAAGTCGMGPSDDDVVDPQLRVRGVENLRVVDLSVLPILVSGNSNGPTMAVAWRAADMILGRE